MIVITSVNAQGQVVRREYDNRRAKFYEGGEQLEITMPELPQMQQQLRGPAPVGTAMSSMPQGEAGKNTGSGSGMMRNNRPKTEAEMKYQNRLKWDTKSGNIRTLKIQMGMACNYSCTYCKQAVHASSAEVSKMEDVDHFIKTFDTWCTTPKSDRIRIQLWGGEPLVYIKKFKKLIAFLRGRFDNAEISTITNGSLLDLEMAKYLLENDIQLGVSHDGPLTKAFRLEDPLEEGSASREGLRYFAQHNKQGLYLNAVMTKLNADPKATSDYVRAQFPEGCDVRLGYEGPFMVEDITQFTEDQFWTPEEFVELRKTIVDQMRSGDAAMVPPFDGKFRTMLMDWSNPFFNIRKDEFSKCSMDDGFTLAVTLKGKALVCHSSSHEIGSVYKLADAKMSNANVTHWAERKECRTCPVLNICRGACMDIPAGTPEWAWTCENQFHFHLAIFEAAFEQVFGERILSITGDYVRPELPKVKTVIHLKSV